MARLEDWGQLFCSEAHQGSIELNGYRNITFWESFRRQERLIEFNGHLATYFTAIREGQTDQAGEARTSINLMLKDVRAIVYAAEVYPVINWTPPRFVGGPSNNIDVFDNLFYLDRFSIGPDQVSDLVLRTFGVYESNHFRSFLRTLNPLWWVWRIFNWIARLPFLLLGTAGFNSARAERSVLGRLLKLVFTLVTLIAAFLSILSYLELLDEFLKLIADLVNYLYTTMPTEPQA